MRKIILLLFTFCSLFIYGQKKTINLPIDSTTKLITYSEVVFVDSISKQDDLYTRARLWFAQFYMSSNHVLQIDDKDSGRLFGKASFEVSTNTVAFLLPFGYIHYNIQISVKDNRYKYVITNFIHEGKYYGTRHVETLGACESLIDKKSIKYPAYTYRGILKNLDEYVNLIISNLKTFMEGKSSKIIEDNW